MYQKALTVFSNTRKKFTDTTRKPEKSYFTGISNDGNLKGSE
ncbi:hypothetical protein UNSWDHB_383 [Dehalobacter sp. UNSWDHB]|nr:hypothetical protein DHBDCA_p515 [Dehalobacter sp. DCA]AFV04579.1 hypothetical protein DCF50_p573 [Dehalobacter sp. CF]EQB22266.1 hypothetical protein UNSWDHB_383 [Dehalobacter sp. UNSWDHB]